MRDVDEYLKKVDKPERSELERVRKIIAKSVPEAEEKISYAMPGFSYKGKYLITYAAFKNHMSLFPGGEVADELGDKLKKYKVSKGTIQFTLDNPLTETLIKQIVKIRCRHIEVSLK